MLVEEEAPGVEMRICEPIDDYGSWMVLKYAMIALSCSSIVETQPLFFIFLAL